MRIGIDARSLSREHPAGIGNYVIEVLSRMKDLVTDQELYLYSDRPFLHFDGWTDKIRPRVIPGKNGTLWARFDLPKIIQEDGIDVFWGPEHILPARNRHTRNIRMVVSIHDLALLVHPAWGRRYNVLVQKLFVPPSARGADQILTISEASRRDIVRLCKVPESKITVTYLAGSEAKSGKTDFSVENSAAKVDNRKNSFLYVGTIEPRKNIEAIIKGFEVLCRNLEKNPEDAKAELPNLVLAGGIGWKADYIVELVKQSSYKDRIDLAGYVNEEKKEELYREAAAFVFPSHYEGFGIPLVEAMKRGVPVITDRGSSLPEVAGQAGFYIEDENDAEALADRMREVLDLGEEERKRVIDLGFGQAERFSWDKCALETFNNLTNQGKCAKITK